MCQPLAPQGLPLKTIFRPRVLISMALAAALVGGIAVVGLVLHDPKRASAENAASSTTTTDAASTTTSSSTTTTAPPPTTTTMAPPAQVVLPTPPAGGFRSGSSGLEVQAYEQRLLDLHFDPGAVDGKYDQNTVYAVQGLEKLLNMERTGVIGPGEQLALSVFQWPAPLAPDGEPNRTEIDVTRQVLILYQNGAIRLITPVSTGSGVHYCYTPKGQPNVRACEYALTPSGKYNFYSYVNGWHKSPLGQLYNPFYFNSGIAVHGYKSVPTTPASHGCVRIPMPISEYFHTLVSKGDPVYVFGGSDHKSPVSSSRVAPPPPPVIDTTPTTVPGETTTTIPETTTTAAPTTTTAAPTTTTATTPPDTAPVGQPGP